MNYLAHAFLSFHQPEILVGNMISDFVKGKKKDNYPELVQKGIMLHRAIDAFTDTHEVTRNAKQFFSPYYRLYAGAFVDVVYDHFLANDQNEFNPDQLNGFSQETYSLLNRSDIQFPEPFALMLHYMQKQNWLYNYRYKWGIQNSFGGLVRRAAYLTDSAPAFAVFELHYEELQQCYTAFFPELKKMALQYFQDIFSV